MKAHVARALSYVTHEVAQYGKPTPFVNEIRTMRAVKAQDWQQAVNAGLTLKKRIDGGEKYGDIVFCGNPASVEAKPEPAPEPANPLRELIADKLREAGQDMRGGLVQLTIDRLVQGVYDVRRLGASAYFAKPDLWGPLSLRIVREVAELDPPITAEIQFSPLFVGNKLREVDQYGHEDGWEDETGIYFLFTTKSRLAEIEANPSFASLTWAPHN